MTHLKTFSGWLVNRHTPLKKLTLKEIKLRNKPWLSMEILKMIKIRNKIFVRKKIQPNKEKFKIQRNNIM